MALQVRAGDQATGDQVAEADADDSDYGWAMFLAFICAVLSITFAVCVLTMVNTWWMLGVTVALHVGITAIMMRVVLGAFRTAAYQQEGGRARLTRVRG